MATMIHQLRQLIARHHKKTMWLIIALWASLFLPVWTFLGQAQANFNAVLLIGIFPFLGVLSIIAAIIGRKLSLFIFGLTLLFAFPLTMAMGYALFGP